MGFFDWIILALVLAALLYGLKSGAVKTGLTVAGVFVAMLLSGQFAGRIVPIFTDSIANEALITVIGYVIIFVAVFIAVSILTSVAKAVMKVTLTGWIDRLLGVGVGLAVGVLISLAMTMLLARLAYVFETGDHVDKNRVEQAVEDHLKGGVRTRIDEMLTGASLVPVLVEVSNLLPANALGLVPADFRTAFAILESRIDNR